MRTIDLALKDLRQIARDRRAALFILIMPVAFTLLFGFAFGGFEAGGDGEPEDVRLPVGIRDEDGSQVSGQLLLLLAQSAVIRPVGEEVTAAELESKVADGELAAAAIIPAGFGAGAGTDEPRALAVIADLSDGAAATAGREVEARVERLASAAASARISTALREAQLPFADDAARQAYFTAALTNTLSGWASAPVTLVVGGTGVQDAPAGEADGVYGSNAFSHTSPGMMAQFAIAGLMAAAGILVVERKSGCLRRLVTTPTSRLEILLGHYLAMFLMILGQLLILVLFGQLFLRLDYFRAPVATLLVIGACALFCASLGLLIGAVARTDEQVIVYALIPMFLLAALGGAWLPLELTPTTFQRIAFFTPLAWMTDALKDILIRGQGLAAIMPAAGVLTLYAVIFFALAVWRFRFD